MVLKGDRFDKAEYTFLLEMVSLVIHSDWNSAI